MNDKFLHFNRLTDINNLEHELSEQSLSKQYKELTEGELKENNLSAISDILKTNPNSNSLLFEKENLPVAISEGEYSNLKITTLQDL